jgi:hypothetical protein
MKTLLIAFALLLSLTGCRPSGWSSSVFPWRRFPEHQEANVAKLQASVPYRGDVTIIERPNLFDYRSGLRKLKQKIIIQGQFEGTTGVTDFRDDYWVIAYPLRVEHRDGDTQGFRIVVQEESGESRTWSFEYRYDSSEKKLRQTRVEGEFTKVNQ